ncbi:WXG100 family type VII secretion target [Mycobacterium sp.]|uniref:WXG100 family type VII secretion target n=1 Tax=Mycobacterium sp. TaxID=1785 RepID=UPI003BAA512D
MTTPDPQLSYGSDDDGASGPAVRVTDNVKEAEGSFITPEGESTSFFAGIDDQQPPAGGRVVGGGGTAGPISGSGHSGFSPSGLVESYEPRSKLPGGPPPPSEGPDGGSSTSDPPLPPVDSPGASGGGDFVPPVTSGGDAVRERFVAEAEAANHRFHADWFDNVATATPEELDAARAVVPSRPYVPPDTQQLVEQAAESAGRGDLQGRLNLADAAAGKIMDDPIVGSEYVFRDQAQYVLDGLNPGERAMDAPDFAAAERRAAEIATQRAAALRQQEVEQFSQQVAPASSEQLHSAADTYRQQADVLRERLNEAGPVPDQHLLDQFNHSRRLADAYSSAAHLADADTAVRQASARLDQVKANPLPNSGDITAAQSGLNATLRDFNERKDAYESLLDDWRRGPQSPPPDPSSRLDGDSLSASGGSQARILPGVSRDVDLRGFERAVDLGHKGFEDAVNLGHEPPLQPEQPGGNNRSESLLYRQRQAEQYYRSAAAFRRVIEQNPEMPEAARHYYTDTAAHFDELGLKCQQWSDGENSGATGSAGAGLPGGFGGRASGSFLVNDQEQVHALADRIDTIVGRQKENLQQVRSLIAEVGETSSGATSAGFVQQAGQLQEDLERHLQVTGSLPQLLRDGTDEQAAVQNQLRQRLERTI